MTCLDDYVHGANCDVVEGVLVGEETKKAFHRGTMLIEKVTFGSDGEESVETISRIQNSLTEKE